MSAAVLIDKNSVPRLPRGVRLKFDEPRDQWVLLAPERMFVLDAVALEIVKGCDGEASVDALVDALAKRFEAPRGVIFEDVVALLRDFMDKGVISV